MRRLALGVAVFLLLVGTALAQSTWPLPSQTRPVTQGGDWTISHIGSQVHVSGSVSVSGGSITATTGPIPHISAVTHVAGYGTFKTVQHETSTIAHVSSVTHVVGVTRFHYSGALRATQLRSCGTTTATVVVTNTDRRDLYIKNIGLPTNPATAHTVFLGFGTTGHVALSTANGYALHVAGVVLFQNDAQTQNFAVSQAATELVLKDYQGPLSCISTGSGANLSVIEVLR